MLLYLVALAAAQSPGAVVLAPPANAATAQAAPAKPEKKKRRKHECTGSEAMTGTHLIPCEAPDPHDLELQEMNGAAMARFADPDSRNSVSSPR